jgi:hypothetical protein
LLLLTFFCLRSCFLPCSMHSTACLTGFACKTRVNACVLARLGLRWKGQWVCDVGGRVCVCAENVTGTVIEAAVHSAISTTVGAVYAPPAFAIQCFSTQTWCAHNNHSRALFIARNLWSAWLTITTKAHSVKVSAIRVFVKGDRTNLPLLLGASGLDIVMAEHDS